MAPASPRACQPPLPGSTAAAAPPIPTASRPGLGRRRLPRGWFPPACIDNNPRPRTAHPPEEKEPLALARISGSFGRVQVWRWRVSRRQVRRDPFQADLGAPPISTAGGARDGLAEPTGIIERGTG